MTTEAELAEAFQPAAPDELARQLFELRAEIHRLQRAETAISAHLKAEIERTGEPIYAEGIPALRYIERSAGLAYDSHAILEMCEQRPHEWRRIVELGAVSLSTTVLRDALKRGQLAGLPTGGIERRTKVLAFDRD